MQRQITRISLFQTAKVAAALYFVVAVVGSILFFLASLVSPAARAGGSAWVLILAPFVYALAAFVFTFIGAWVYNGVAKVVGGIEYTSTETRDF